MRSHCVGALPATKIRLAPLIVRSATEITPSAVRRGQETFLYVLANVVLGQAHKSPNRATIWVTGKRRFQNKGHTLRTYLRDSLISGLAAHPGNCCNDGRFCGAGDRIRTGDILLGRQTLYQLSYSRRGVVRPLALGRLRSGWRDSNPRPQRHKRRALPTALHPESANRATQYRGGRGEKSRRRREVGRRGGAKLKVEI